MNQWEINGATVPPIYLLMEEEETVKVYLDSMPEDHPDLQEWIDRYNGIWAKIGEVRKCALS
jgi:hypothetical protein